MTEQNELVAELSEALNFLVNSGYYSNQEITEYSQETIVAIYQDHDLAEPTMAEMSSSLLKIRRVKPETNYYSRLRKFFDQLNQERIIAID